MKILIICTQTLIRQTLRWLVEQLDGHTVVLEAAGYREGLDVLHEHADLSLTLVNIGLLDVDRTAVLEAIYERRPKLPLVVVSESQDQNDIRNAISTGAQGFIPMSFNSEEVLVALRRVLAGEIFIPSEITKSGHLSEAVTYPPRRAFSDDRSDTRDMYGLTPRHRDILALLKLGKSNKEIARNLNLVEGTIKIHCMAIFRELGVTNRTQAAIKAKRIFADDSNEEESYIGQASV